MEKHILKFGNSSFAMILPKKWLVKNRLKGSDGIFVSENSGGDLVISVKSPGKRSFGKAVDSSTNPEILTRFVALYYVRGVGKLVIHSKDGFTKAQIEMIQKELNDECPGFEIISQSNNEMQIEDLTDMREVDIDRILTRLRSLVMQEFREVKEGNVEAAVAIEGLVDRFYMLGLRYVNMVQPNDIIKYYRTVALLEMISDNLGLVAPHLSKSDAAIIDKLRLVFDKSADGFKGNQNSIVEVATIRNSVIKDLKRSKFDRYMQKMLKDIATYSSQIAEFGLLEEQKIV